MKKHKNGTEKFYYVDNIDVTKAKEMYQYLQNHFEYYTLNSWNGLKSIANKVKLYDLLLADRLRAGNWTDACRLVFDNTDLTEDYFNSVNQMLEDFEADHPGYMACFNGRSDGYIVLSYERSNGNILPYIFDYSDNYEDFKEECISVYGSVRNAIPELRRLTELVRDFDKLCDELREVLIFYTNALIEYEKGGNI